MKSFDHHICSLPHARSEALLSVLGWSIFAVCNSGKHVSIIMSDALAILWLIVLLSRLSRSANSSFYADKHQGNVYLTEPTRPVQHGLFVTQRTIVSVEISKTMQLYATTNWKNQLYWTATVWPTTNRVRPLMPDYVSIIVRSQNSNLDKIMDYIYTRLPRKPEELLDKSACSHFHRTGLLCGDCEEEHSPFVQPKLCKMSRWSQKLVEIHLSWICTSYILLYFHCWQ